MKLNIKRRIKHLFIALDQLAWVVATLGHGYPDETTSAAAYRMESKGKIAGKILRPLIDLLFCPFEKEHCFNSYLSEINMKHLPSSYYERNKNE